MRRTMLAALAGALIVAPTAVAAPPATLDGETFHDPTPTITSLVCTGGDIALGYSTTGTASGPYPGTYAERGLFVRPDLAAIFRIDSPAGRVVGVKTAAVGVTCLEAPPCDSADACADRNAVFAGDGRYEAFISGPEGAFADRGEFGTLLFHCPGCVPPGPQLNRFEADFSSDLEQTTPASGSIKDECKQGGWRRFGFRNQGECIAFVR